MQALILAGGEGTRLRPLTLYTPKPVVPIANRPFLHYQLEMLNKAGVRETILSLSYKPEKIADIFGDGSNLGLSLSYMVEESPLGTAGAFKHSEKAIRDTTIVLNGDVLTDIDLSAVVRLHKEKKATATIVLVPVENPCAYGLVETDADGRIVRFLEKPKPEEITCNTINAGLYVLEPEVLKYIPPNINHSFEYGLFPKLLLEGEPFYSFAGCEYWLDIGTPARYLQANLDVLAGRLSYKPERMVSDKWTAEIDRLSLIAPSVVLNGSVKIENSVIGPNCTISEGASIKNSVLPADARVGSNAKIEGAVLGRGCYIGSSSVIGPGAILGDGSSLTEFSRTV